MQANTSHLRAHLNGRLALLGDPAFNLKVPYYANEISDIWPDALANLASLRTEKGAFLDLYCYDWVLDANSFNSPFEAQLQWRLLNVLSDISPDHPSLQRCSNLVVRIIASSCARTHVRTVDGFHVIVISSGYLSILKGLLRLWLWGCALGQSVTHKAPQHYQDFSVNYIAAIQQFEDKMAEAARVYVRTIIQLLENQVPIENGVSVFDGSVVKREEWLTSFAVFATAIDGFILFHEAAHILAGDSCESGRTLDAELEADRGSISLCIIDEARRGGYGTVHLGGPIFFAMELLRLLCEECIELLAGRHDPLLGRYAGIDELTLRLGHCGAHVRECLGPRVHALYCEWSACMGLVFDTVRWGLLHTVGSQIRLSDFVRLQESSPLERPQSLEEAMLDLGQQSVAR